MLHRCLLACVVVFTVSLSACSSLQAQPFGQTPGDSQARAVYRAQIRQMPLLERPNRPGHFIGNTIRGVYYGGQR